MKKLKNYMGILAIFALLFTSCSTEETSVANPADDTSAILEFGAVLNNLANRAASDTKNHFAAIPDCSAEEPAMAEITFSVDGGASQTIMVDILNDSDGYFTAYDEALKIAIASGGSVSVELQGFMVYDSGDNLIWVAPSDLNDPGLFDGYVDNALPFSTTVYSGTKPYIDVEVLCFDRRMVNEYGYPFFDLVPGKLYPLCFFANYCTEAGRHFVGNYSVELTYIQGNIQLYSSSTPVTGQRTNGEYFADPVCLVVPESPYDNMDTPYLSYTITPLDWNATYGDIDNTPLTTVLLSGNDVLDLLNADGTTNEYIHILIGCEEIPGCIPGVPTEGDRDGDCIPDNDDNCPDTFNPDQADGDGDGVGDVCDLCPDRFGSEANGCPQNEPCIGSDPDGDGFYGDCDNCPEEYSLTNNGCPVDDCIDDSDGDGINDCDDGCPSEAGPESNNGCPVVTPPSGCGTAFMFGNTRINEISNSNRWGWAQEFDTDDGSSQTFNFWRGAGQNDTSKGVLAGTVTITVDGDEVEFEIDLNDGFTIDDLHVYLSEESPGNTAKSPGKYNRNDDVDDDATNFTLTRTSSDSSFWVIVHAGDTCNN